MAAVDLMEFVEASNAIEGYIPSAFGRGSRHPVFTQHLAVARRIASGEWMTAKAVHAALFAGLTADGLRAGEYRKGVCTVAGRPTMDPRSVAEAMRAWEAAASADPRQDNGNAWIWALHHQFLAIHPFADGNGRTARLLLNQMRLRNSLTWMTIRIEDADTYAADIRAWRTANGW